jgi:hypothetical protein
MLALELRYIYNYVVGIILKGKYMRTGEILGAEKESDVKTGRNGWRRSLGVKVGAFAAAGALLFTGCDSAAETVSDNLSTAADNFELERRIVFLNGITDDVPLVIEGRCSIEADIEDDQLEVTCKTGPDAYKKHFLGLSDNMSYIVEQQEAADADEYRTRVMIKPEQLIPNFDLNTSVGK